MESADLTNKVQDLPLAFHLATLIQDCTDLLYSTTTKYALFLFPTEFSMRVKDVIIA